MIFALLPSPLRLESVLVFAKFDSVSRLRYKFASTYTRRIDGNTAPARSVHVYVSHRFLRKHTRDELTLSV
jgi:hypothetical protein